MMSGWWRLGFSAFGFMALVAACSGSPDEVPANIAFETESKEVSSEPPEDAPLAVAAGFDLDSVCTHLERAYGARSRSREILHELPSQNAKIALRSIFDSHETFEFVYRGSSNPYFSDSALLSMHKLEQRLIGVARKGESWDIGEIEELEADVAEMHGFARENCENIAADTIDIEGVFDAVED